MNKQTAVEWLAEQMLHPEIFNPYLNQALAMEKEQMGDAYYDGKNNGMDICNPLSRAKGISFEQYYNQTYGK